MRAKRLLLWQLPALLKQAEAEFLSAQQSLMAAWSDGVSSQDLTVRQKRVRKAQKILVKLQGYAKEPNAKLLSKLTQAEVIGG